MYLVVLKSLSAEGERIVLAKAKTIAQAQEWRRTWRKSLGHKLWAVDRRPGLDTYGHLAISIEDHNDVDT